MTDVKRTYNSSRRAEAKQHTRLAILDAAVKLHTQGNLSLTDLAKEAGVSLPTVRKHFPTLEDLLAGCSAHFDEKFQPPSPEDWMNLATLQERARVCIDRLFDYYETASGVLWLAFRIRDESGVMENNVMQMEGYVDVLVQTVLGSDYGGKDELKRIARSVLHPMFHRSLRIHGGLCLTSSKSQAIHLILSNMI